MTPDVLQACYRTGCAPVDSLLRFSIDHRVFEERWWTLVLPVRAHAYRVLCPFSRESWSFASSSFVRGGYVPFAWSDDMLLARLDPLVVFEASTAPDEGVVGSDGSLTKLSE